MTKSRSILAARPGESDFSRLALVLSEEAGAEGAPRAGVVVVPSWFRFPRTDAWLRRRSGSSLGLTAVSPYGSASVQVPGRAVAPFSPEVASGLLGPLLGAFPPRSSLRSPEVSRSRARGAKGGRLLPT